MCECGGGPAPAAAQRRSGCKPRSAGTRPACLLAWPPLSATAAAPSPAGPAVPQRAGRPHRPAPGTGRLPHRCRHLPQLHRGCHRLCGHLPHRFTRRKQVGGWGRWYGISRGRKAGRRAGGGEAGQPHRPVHFFVFAAPQPAGRAAESPPCPVPALPARRGAALAWEAAFVELASGLLSEMAEGVGLRLSFSTERSVQDELARESGSGAELGRGPAQAAHDMGGPCRGSVPGLRCHCCWSISSLQGNLGCGTHDRLGWLCLPTHPLPSLPATHRSRRRPHRAPVLSRHAAVHCRGAGALPAGRRLARRAGAQQARHAQHAQHSTARRAGGSISPRPWSRGCPCSPSCLCACNPGTRARPACCPASPAGPRWGWAACSSWPPLWSALWACAAGRA